jgi:RHS repeat-associated protein
MADEPEQGWYERNIEDPVGNRINKALDEERARISEHDYLGRLQHDVKVGMAKGAYYTGKGIVEGVVGLAQLSAYVQNHPVEALEKAAHGAVGLARDAYYLSPFSTPEQKEELGRRALEFARPIYEALKKQLADEWDKARQQGKEAEMLSKWLTRLALELLLSKGTGELSETAKVESLVAKCASKAEKTAEALRAEEKLAEALRAEEKAAEAARAAEESGDLGRAAERNRCDTGRCTVTGEPVDVATGRVLTSATDLELPGPLPLRFERFWYSTSSHRGPLGHGWHHGYDMALLLYPPGVVVRLADGRFAAFAHPRPQAPSWNAWDRLFLHHTSEGYVLEDQDGLRYSFQPVPGSREEWLLSKVQDPNGNAIQLVRRGKRLTEILDSAGRRLTVLSDEADRVVRITEADPDRPDGTRTLVAYRYDERGNLIEVRDALGHPFRYAYQGHLLVRLTDRNGFSFHYEYDGVDEGAWCIRTWGDGGTYRRQITYDRVNRQTTVVDSRDARTTYFWDDRGLVTRMIDALGGETVTTWDRNGWKTAVTDPGGHTTRMYYDARGNLLLFINPLGHPISARYDEFGNPVFVRLPDGSFVKQGFDRRGNLVWVEDALGGRTTYTYDERGNLTAITDAAGGVERFRYDERGDVIEWVDAEGARHEFHYTAHGELAGVLDPGGRRREYCYDTLDRLTQARYPDGTRCSFTYDPEGNLTRMIDAAGYVTEYRYGGFNQVVERIEPTGHHLRYAYDTEENLTALENQRGACYRFRHDLLKRLTEEVTFDGVVRRYGYDRSHCVVSFEEVSADGEEVRTTRLARNALGQLLAKHLPSGEVHSFEYDAFGRVVRAETPAHRVELQYNLLGDLIRDEQDGQVIHYEYEQAGRLRRRISPSGRVVTYRYSPSGLLAGLSLDLPRTHPLSVAYTYNSNRQLAEERLPGGVRGVYDYDAGGRLVRQTRSGPQHVRTRGYRYSPSGDIAAIEDSIAGLRQFTYDPAGRLAEVRRGPERVETFDFDPAGNITRGGHHTFSQAQGNRLASKDGRPYRYNGYGDLIERPADGRWGPTYQRLAYDDQHRLTRVETGSGDLLARFEYDALGRRVKKVTPDREYRYLWEGGRLLAEADGEQTREYTFEEFAPTTQSTDDGVYFYHTDHLGTPLELTDAAGEVVWQGRCKAFGALESSEGRVHQPFRLPGQYADQETGLHYSLFRYYDPEDGRFLTQDPIGLDGGENLYSYPLDPVQVTDPLGLSSEFGKTRLAERAYAFKKAEGLVDSGRNVAVIGYVTKGSNIKFVKAASDGRHAERLAFDKLPKYIKNAPPEQRKQWVRAVYTQLEPCGEDFHNCKAWLKRELPNVRVWPGFPYPAHDKPGRQEGVKQMRKASRTACR